MNTSTISYGSVCSGIEAATVAVHPFGWRAAWFAEIEPHPSAVLAHHYPDVANLGDMTTIAARVLSGEVEAPDVLVGGTPCQSFSLAGRRSGLSDPRGQLTIAFLDLADAIDTARIRTGKPPCVIWWENVPGVLSSRDNAFGCFLAGLAGEGSELEPAGRRWSNAGCVLGPQRSVAWRTLDAQYFGLAQRRRRVFVVASARDGFAPDRVLFEREGVRRDSAPCRGEGNENPCLADAGAAATGCWWNGDQVSQTLDAVLHKSQTMPEKNRFPAVLQPMADSCNVVRFLTPREGERLQGISDDYTAIPYRGKTMKAGPRRKMIGNSMAVNVMRWIGGRMHRELVEIGEPANTNRAPAPETA